MHQSNIGEHLQLAVVAAAAAATVTANGTGVDVSSFVGQGIFLLTSAAGTGTAPLYDAKLQESDTLGGAYTDIAGAAFTQVGGAASAQKIAVNLDAAKSFIRVAETLGGTGPSFVRSVSLLGLKQTR